MAEQMRK